MILLINFWQGLSEASKQDLQLPGATQTMPILVTEDEGEDEVFNKDLKKIVLKGISMIERLQTLVTRVCMKQVRQFSLDITNISTIHTIALDQLELGGAQLKAVTLELLTELHQVSSCCLVKINKNLQFLFKSSGFGPGRLWCVESELLVQLLELLLSPDLLPQEVDTISSAWSDCLATILPLMERTHLLYLAIPLIPFWETKLASLPAGHGKLVNDIIQSIVEQRPSRKLLEKVKRNVYSSPSPDWDLLTSLAVSECLQSESFQDHQRDHRISADLVSPSWSFLMANIEEKPFEVSQLERFAKIARKILIAVTRARPNINIDILSLSLMEKVTDCVTKGLAVPGCVQPSLACLEVMLQSCHFLPPPALSSHLAACNAP